MKKVYIKFISVILLFNLFSACRSLQQPAEVEKPIDYSDDEIVQLEISRIKTFQQEDVVKAVWRAILLGKEDLIKECVELTYEKFLEALENKEYFDAYRFYKSLTAYGWNFSKKEIEDAERLYTQDVPGLRKSNPKAPKSISDCMNATVTIWVDRGIKVQRGAGFADIVIGSGFFIDERGYLITNHHVIESMVDEKYEGFSRLYVKLLSDPDTKIPAKVIGYDSVMDLALLKVEIEPEVVLSLGSSSDLKLGDKVRAIGTPVGLEGTLTAGIISSTERKLTTMGNFFQVDAAINSGNSGGPLIDENMKVQAIVFAGMLQFQGLNFAIPVEYLKQILPVLYNSDGEAFSSEVIHPWLSAYGHTMRLGAKKTGLEVQFVMAGGSASLSGLKEGDVITEIDGVKINRIEDFQFFQLSTQPGTLSKCKYNTAEGDSKECFVYFEPRPKDPLVQIYKRNFIEDSFVPIFGMKLKHASSDNKKTYIVSKIISGTAADEMSFSENDFVTVTDIKFDHVNKRFLAQIYTQRKKKGLLDVGMVLQTTFDNPFYF